MKTTAIEQGYLLLGQWNQFGAYQNWCKTQSQPLIYAKKKGQRAHVEMDLIWCGDRDERHGFNDNQLFRAKIQRIHDQVRSSLSLESRGVFTHIERLTLHYTEFVAQAYLAIYCQTIGQQAIAPAFPEPEPDNVVIARMRQAREQRYMLTHAVADSRLRWEWKEFCAAYQWPYISIHEPRRGHADLEIQLPKGVVFLPEITEAILRTGQDAGLKSDRERFTSGTRWYRLDLERVKTVQTIPTQAAQRLAQVVAHMLDEQRCFSPVDESWHQ